MLLTGSKLVGIDAASVGRALPPDPSLKSREATSATKSGVISSIIQFYLYASSCSHLTLLRLRLAMVVIVVITDFNVFEYAQCIVGQDGAGEIQGEEIGSDTEAIQAHQAR